MSQYQRITHLTAETVEVKNLLINGEPFAGTPVPEREEAAVSTPVPAQLDRAEFGDRPTCKELAQAYHDLFDGLTAAGLIAPKGEPAEASESAPETVEVQTPAVTADSAAEPTPQVISAGVVDGA